MDNGSLWRIVGLVLAIIVVIAVVNWILRNLIGILIAVAIVAAVVYLLRNATGRSRTF